MTVTNKKTHPVLTSLQTLLQPDVDPASEGGDVHQAAAILSDKISTALTILTSTPSLHSLALEVVGNGLVFQFKHTPPQLTNKDCDGTLSGQLTMVWQFFDQTLSYCPQGWAGPLYKWCVNVIGRFTQVQSSPNKVDDAMSKWLGQPVLAQVFALLRRCTCLLVKFGQVSYCMDQLFPVCATHAPNLSWLLAHIVSQYPSQMMPILLEHTLSFPYPHTLTPSQPIPHAFTSLTQALSYLSCTHRDHLKQTTLTALSHILSGGSNVGRVRMLLVVASHCPLLTKSAAIDCLQLITPAKIRALMMSGDKITPTKESGDSHVTKSQEEEDEGEILSDDEEMDTSQKSQGPPSASLDEVVGLVSDLLGQLRGKEAVRALNTVMDVYQHTTAFLKTQEEHVEEGEIVHESPLEVVEDASRRIMSNFLSRLHSSTTLTHLTPQRGSVGVDVDLIISVECGLVEWADRLLILFTDENDDAHICITWLHEMIVCVCSCSSELVAGRLLAHLLLHSTTQEQLVRVLEIYWEVHTRHPHLADSAVSAAMGRLQRLSHTHSDKVDHTQCNGTAKEEDRPNEVICFVKNMLTVLERMDISLARQQNTRSAFLSALFSQILAIAQLLPTSLSINAHPQFLITLKLLRCILIRQPKELSYQNNSKLVTILLFLFFSLLKSLTGAILEGGGTELTVEMCLGKCKDLIGWCVKSTPIASSDTEAPHSIQTLAYSIIMESVLSEEMSCYLSKFKISQAHFVKPTPSTHPHPDDHLLSPGTGLCLSALYHPKLSSHHVHHSGKLGSRQREQSHRNTDDRVEVAVTTNTSHLLQLLLVLVSPDPSRTSSKVSSTATPLSTSPMTGVKGLAHIFMDAVAPQSGVGLTQWPEEDSLKYTLEYDLIIKRKFDENPILWHFLLYFSEQNGHPCPLLVCTSLIRSLLTMLSQHWQRSRLDNVSRFPWELESSVLLVECLAKAGWLPVPLSWISELLPWVSSEEIHLLLAAVQAFLKENFKLISSGNTVSSCKEATWLEIIRSTLLNNISRLGHLYPRYAEFFTDSNLKPPLT